MILQSPLTSAVRVVSNYLSMIPATDMFQNINKIDKVRVPVFVIHGNVDQVVPYLHGEKIFELTQEMYKHDFWTVKDCGHNDIESRNTTEYIGKLRDFVQRLKIDESKEKGKEAEEQAAQKELNTMSKTIPLDTKNST